MDSRAIEEQAAAWLIRRDSAQWTEADAAQLAAWLEASTANRVAFLRLEVGWERSERLAALGAGKPPGAVPARGQWRVSPFFEPRQAAQGCPEDSDRSTLSAEPVPAELVVGAAQAGDAGGNWSAGHRMRPRVAWAACLLACVLVGAGFLLLHRGEAYATPIGGTASIPLRDGSNITLNTASKVRVAVTAQERRVELDQGEAYFEVAKDPRHPFVVVAGGRRVVAVGTRFSVLRDKGNEIRVVVTEGKVRFETAEAPLLLPGTIARASGTAVLVERGSVERAEEILSWRSGYLIFDETALSEAVAEFNRYNIHQISVPDPAAATLRISGKFRTTNAEAFIRVLRDGFGIRARDSAGRIVLSTH